MKLKCRICGAEVAHGAPGEENALREHLQPHKWQVLRLIQGAEGDGTFARHLESLLFEVSDRPGPDDDADFFDLQRDLFDDARSADAVNSDLKGAPRPRPGDGK